MDMNINTGWSVLSTLAMAKSQGHMPYGTKRKVLSTENGKVRKTKKSKKKIQKQSRKKNRK